MERFARDFPNDGFTIEDEPDTTPLLLVGLRYELQSRDPLLVLGVKGLLQQRFREPS